MAYNFSSSVLTIRCFHHFPCPVNDTMCFWVAVFFFADVLFLWEAYALPPLSYKIIFSFINTKIPIKDKGLTNIRYIQIAVSILRNIVFPPGKIIP